MKHIIINPAALLVIGPFDNEESAREWNEKLKVQLPELHTHVMLMYTPEEFAALVRQVKQESDIGPFL